MILVFGSQLTKRRSTRAAVVPYTILPTPGRGWQLWFLLGVHTDTGDITDFGGGVKKYEVDVTGGFREFTEETKGVFEKTVTTDDLSTCVAAIQENTRRRKHSNNGDGGMSAIFVPVGTNWFDAAPTLFNATCTIGKGSSHNELSKLVWFSEAQFLRLIRDVEPVPTSDEYIMWSRLRRFYSTIYSDELHDLLYIRYWWFTPYFAIEREKIVESRIRRTVTTTTVQYQLSCPPLLV